MPRPLLYYLALTGLLGHALLALVFWQQGPEAVLRWVDDGYSRARATALQLARAPVPLPPPEAWPAHGPSPALALEPQGYAADGRPMVAADGRFESPGREIAVNDGASLVRAVEQARAGDSILLAPGDYAIGANRVRASTAGTSGLPIHVRAGRYGDARLFLDSVEGFHVTGPYWVFDNLDIRGVCADHDRCEHAFHVTGAARGFVLRNSRLRDFNAAIKVNGTGPPGGRQYPDQGLIYRTTIRNTAPRQTAAAVTHVDVVAAGGWVLRQNILADAAKARSNRISYLAFFKGGGAGGVMEGNLAVCNWAFEDDSIRVGLSLGGGGTGRSFCRSADCASEHTGGVIRHNLILNCPQDVGIHLRSAQDSRIHNNLLYRTGGIAGQFAASSGETFNNISDAGLSLRRGADLAASHDIRISDCTPFLPTGGRNCAADLLRAPLAGDLRPADALALVGRGRRIAAGAADFCGRVAGTPANDIGPWHLSAGLPDCLPEAMD